MKLVIQIPCWREERTIAQTIRSLPRTMPGISKVEVIVIDDGSDDDSARAAQDAGADEVIRLPRHVGLAKAFSAGIDAALRRGADVLVNTDADLQYPSERIPDLVQPITDGRADMVVGDRLSYSPTPFAPAKMALERLGSWVIRSCSGAQVQDAASGFRAFSREVIETLVIHGTFSYTLESLVLAGMNGFRVVNVAIPVNPPRRASRLVRSIPQYIARSGIAIIRAYLMYHPLRFFAGIGALLLVAAGFIGVRFLAYYFFSSNPSGHVQSLILLAVLAGMGFQSIMLGLLADVVAANRRLLEKMRLAGIRRNGAA